MSVSTIFYTLEMRNHPIILKNKISGEIGEISAVIIEPWVTLMKKLSVVGKSEENRRKYKEKQVLVINPIILRKNA